MIKGLAHAAITVGDLERSLAFYRDLLGFPVTRTLDTPDGSKIVILDIAGSGELELLKRPRTRPLPEGYGEPETIGLCHLAIEVDNVAAEWARLEERGVKPTGQPLFRKPGGPRCCHFFDPDGVVVELIEPPDTWWPKEERLD
ncbi:MAG: VOC family protein [Dehalococcoidia bacterium]|nr:VOC family protein [Dehalococcoidia bacterium]